MRFGALAVCTLVQFSLCLSFPRDVFAQSPRDAARERQAAEGELEKAKTDVQNKETELAEQKAIAEQAEKDIANNQNVDEQIKQTQEQINQMTQTLNKLLNDLPLNDADRKALRTAVGGDTAPVDNRILAGIIRDAMEKLKKKLEELKKLDADPDRDKKRMDAEDKLRDAKKRIGELEGELAVGRPKLTELAEDVKAKQKAEAEAIVNEQVRTAAREKAEAERQKKAADERLKQTIKAQKAAIAKLNEARAEAERRRALPGIMATAFRLIREGATRIAKLVAGDLGEAIAEAATTQLEIGAAILDNLDKLIPNIDEIKRLPNGTYVATTAGQIAINDLIDALNALVKANRELEAAINAAKNAKLKLQRTTETLESKQRQRQQLGQADTNSTGDKISYSIVPDSHQLITSTTGQQHLATMIDFAARDDLNGLRSFTADLSTAQQSGTLSSDSQIVLNIAGTVVAEADRMTEWVIETHNAAHEEVTPVDAIVAVSEKLLALDRQTNTSTIGLPISAQDFRLHVFQQFENSISDSAMRQVSNQADQQNLAGASVVKGTAKLPDSSQAPDAVVTVTFTLFDSEGNEQEDHTEVTTAAPDGSFEVPIPENATPNEVKIAGTGYGEGSPLSGTAFISDPVKPGAPPNRQHSRPVIQGTVYRVLSESSNSETIRIGTKKSQIDDLILGRPNIYDRDAVPFGSTLANNPFQGITAAPDFAWKLRNNQPVPKTWQVENIEPGDVETAGDASDVFVQPRPRMIAIATNPDEFNQPVGSYLVEVPGELSNRILWQVQEHYDPSYRRYLNSDSALFQHQPDDEATASPSLSKSPEIHIVKLVSDVIISDEELDNYLQTLESTVSGVLWVERDLSRIGEGIHPQDLHFRSSGSWEQEYADQWALQRIAGEPDAAAWPETINTAEQCVVAVIGSGVDWTHPELMGQMWRNIDEIPDNGVDDDENGYVDDVWGWNFRDDNANVLDYGGHDTHIAGVIAARWDDQGIAGVNPQARIMALKAANQLAQSDSISIAQSIVYAVDNGARVINLSYGGPAPSRVEQAAINYAVAKGVLVVVASGNKAQDASEYAIAGSSGVLTVAGTTLEDKRAPFSNYGQPIDLAAPSMDVLGLRARGTDFLLYVAENDAYVGGTGVVGESRDLYRASGTSFAAPLVSGAASLLFSLDSSLTNSDVARKLLASVEDVEVTGADQFTGFGLLDIKQAIAASPDDYLAVKIEKLAPARVDNAVVLQVNGTVAGSRISKRELQVAFGEDPANSDWETVRTDYDTIGGKDDLLGRVPIRFITKKGVWSVRVIAETLSGKAYESRATININ